MTSTSIMLSGEVTLRPSHPLSSTPYIIGIIINTEVCTNCIYSSMYHYQRDRAQNNFDQASGQNSDKWSLVVMFILS